MRTQEKNWSALAAFAIAGALAWYMASTLGGAFPTSVSGLPDVAAAAEVVEIPDGGTYTITAAPVTKKINGRAVRMLAYNGSIPGPTLKARQGSTFTVVFRNDTELENTIHWHGVRLEEASDGVPGMTQDVVPPGGSFSYTVHVPDAGMFWYHPHVRDDYAIERGLYGNVWVTPADGSSWNAVDREVPLFVDDILVGDDGAPAPFGAAADRTLMGRYGNVTLVSGEEDYSLDVAAGEVTRLYLTSSASARPFRLAFPGAKVKLVGGDSGLYERDAWVDDVTVAPSERAIVELRYDEPGAYSILNRTPEVSDRIAAVNVSAGTQTAAGRTFGTLAAHPEVTASVDPFRAALSRAPEKQLDLKMTMSMPGMEGMGESMHGGGMMGAHMMPDGTMMAGGMMGGSPDGIEWEDAMAAMNALSTTENVSWKLVDHATGEENMGIEWSFDRGDDPVIRIFNDPTSMHPMQHPIHFHGQRFLVANRNGVVEENLVWKDTVLVPAGQYVDIVLDASNPGTWMAHCHILEHIEAGMMMAFAVE
jgi:FtsP/CotA-like multicopper oxidase with cupredoxin domain